MRTFDYIRLADQTWDMDILNLVAKIHGNDRKDREGFRSSRRCGQCV